jgi:hypothetical protein
MTEVLTMNITKERVERDVFEVWPEGEELDDPGAENADYVDISETRDESPDEDKSPGDRISELWRDFEIRGNDGQFDDGELDDWDPDE